MNGVVWIGGLFMKSKIKKYIEKERRRDDNKSSPEARGIQMFWKSLIPKDQTKDVTARDVKNVRMGWNLLCPMIFNNLPDINALNFHIPNESHKIPALYLTYPMNNVQDKSILWFHGGSFVLGSMNTDRYILDEITKR